MSMKKSVKAWCGVVNGKVHRKSDEQFGYMAVFKSKKEAKASYELAIPCIIIYEITKE